jgi:hypothetical protein
MLVIGTRAQILKQSLDFFFHMQKLLVILASVTLFAFIVDAQNSRKQGVFDGSNAVVTVTPSSGAHFAQLLVSAISFRTSTVRYLREVKREKKIY